MAARNDEGIRIIARDDSGESDEGIRIIARDDSCESDEGIRIIARDDSGESDDDSLVVTKAVPIQSSKTNRQSSKISVGEVQSLSKKAEALRLNGENRVEANQEKYVPEKNMLKNFTKLGTVLRIEEEEDEDSEKYGYKSNDPYESEDEDTDYVRSTGAYHEDDDDDGLVVSKARPIQNPELDDGHTNAARVIIEGDTNGLSEEYILHQLRNKIQELPSISSRRTFFCPSVMVKINGVEYPVTALEYAAFRDKGGIVQFLFNTITDNCFEHIVEAVKYLDQRDVNNHSLLHGMVASSLRMSNSLRVLIEAKTRLSSNGQEFLLFNPTVEGERTVLDVVRQNQSLAPFVRDIVERELATMLHGHTGWLGDKMAVEMVWQDLSDEQQGSRATPREVPYTQLGHTVSQEPAILEAVRDNHHNQEPVSDPALVIDEEADLIVDEEPVLVIDEASLSESVQTISNI